MAFMRGGQPPNKSWRYQACNRSYCCGLKRFIHGVDERFEVGYKVKKPHLIRQPCSVGGLRYFFFWRGELYSQIKSRGEQFPKGNC